MSDYCRNVFASFCYESRVLGNQLGERLHPRHPTEGKPRSNPGRGGSMRRASGAEVSSTERLSPRLNLRRSTRVGAWNVMSLSEVRDKRTGQLD